MAEEELTALEVCLGPKFTNDPLCLPGELCDSDADCEEACVPAILNGVNVTVCSSDAAEFSVVAWIFVWTVMSSTVFLCIFLALRNGYKLKKAMAARKAKKKAAAKGELTGDNANQLQKRCLDLLDKSKEIAAAFDAQLEDVNKLYLVDDVKQSIHMFNFLVLATLSASQQQMQDQQASYMYQRRLWYLATYLEQGTTGLWYALNTDNQVQQNQAALRQTQQLLIRTAEYFQLGSPFGNASVSQILRARHDDPNWGTKSGNMRQLEARAMAFKPAFAAPTAASKEKLKPLVFRQARRYPFFYGFIIAMMLSIFLSFAVKINTNNDEITQGGAPFASAFIEAAGGAPVLEGRPGGYGKSFLPIPPQYNIQAGTPQGVIVPVIYGVMHNALFMLGILPIPMARGLWRDIVSWAPVVRKIIPTDDLISMHRQIAYTLFGAIFTGALLWTITMTIECRNNVPGACLAFTPAVKNYFDPIENVLALRFSVFLTWPFMGLIYFARAGPPRFLAFRWVKTNWFEICYFLHTFIAHFTLTLALISRTEVFYPVTIGWGVYWLDLVREIFFHTKSADLVDSQLFGRAKDGVPTSMRLKFQPSSKLKTGSGQYCYIKIPSVDQVWHPFTLCSASNDSTVQVHVGIIAGKGDWKKKKTGQYGATEWESKSKTWTYKVFKKVSKRGNATIPAVIRGPYGTTFTDCFDASFGGTCIMAAGTGLSAAESVFRETLERRKAGIPGPPKLWVVYSCRTEDDLIWLWERIISLLVKAVEDRIVDINALNPRAYLFDWIGMQIYVTQSSPTLLQQFQAINRAQGGKAFNLRDSIFQRATIGRGNNAIKPINVAGNPKQAMSAYGPASGMGDMESGSQYGQFPAPLRTAIQSISRGTYTDPQLGSDKSRQGVAGQVREWLLNKIVAGSLDDEDVHIERYIRGIMNNLKETGGTPRLSTGFCGPPSLGITISEACRAVNSSSGRVTFVSEAQ